MQLSHEFITFFMCDQAFPHVFITFLTPPSFHLGAHWALLGSPFRDGGGAVELLGHPLGQNEARIIKMRVSEAILAQVEVARGSQRLSMHRF